MAESGFAQFLGLGCDIFPREIEVVPAEMTVGRSVLVEATTPCLRKIA
jgi:hypothetical protein